MKQNVWLTIQKIGTVLIDRRVWFYLISMGIVLKILPSTADADTLSKEWVDAILLIVQGVTALLGMVLMVYSWTKRPPSGVQYKELPKEIEQVLPVLKKLLEK